MLLYIAIATFLTTILGGLFALHFKDRLHLVLGFSAGAIIGVAFFDILPEALELGSVYFDVPFITGVVAFGFLAYLVIDRFVAPHTHDEVGNNRSMVGAGSISVHSFLDGVMIGLAFQASPAIGLVVAIAVLAHNFSDGLNTVNVVLKNGGSLARAARWLVVDASAPVLGIIATSLFSISESVLGVLLALSSGFFLYIGASDLLPESYHRHPAVWTTVATLLGIGCIYGIVAIAK